MKKVYTIGASALLLIAIIFTTTLYAQSSKTEELSVMTETTGKDFAVLDKSIEDSITPPVRIEPTIKLTAKAETKATPNAEAASTTKTTPKTTSKAAPKATPKTTAKAAPKATPKSTPKAPVTSASGKASAIINTAKGYLGVPYVWGGISPSGFDCSGFINYVYGKHGISLPRVSADQYNAGVSVSKANLKPGDLVFFETYKPGPSHVGIYLGNNQFIHASSGSEKVLISNLSSTYYTSHYIGSRRVIN